MQDKRKGIIKEIAIYLIVILFVALFLIKEYSNVYKTCYVEAGVSVAPEDFFKVCRDDVTYTDASDVIDTKVPGEYHVVLQKGTLCFKSTLIVTDTIAPEGKPVTKTIGYGEPCSEADFVTDITDVTKVTVEYKKQPDLKKIGEQDIELVLRDQGGNETFIESKLVITPVISEVLVEAGGELPKIEDFITDGVKAEFVTDISTIDYSVLGKHNVDIKIENSIYTSSLTVVDTIAPKIVVKDLQGYHNVLYKAEDFVETIDDKTEVSVTFVQEPDVTKTEEVLEICAVDAAGNETVETVKLTRTADTEAPTIDGVEDIYVIIGNSVSYKKGIKVNDNCPQGLDLKVDNSGVNLAVVGTYPITYIAKDFAGNETKVTANVIVKEQLYSEDEVNALADKVLSKIIQEGMTPYEKLKAIYNYTRRNIGYISHSEKGNWVRGAYEGLKDKQGDCYVYACTAKVLLTRAGIKNMDIEKIPAETRHYWNLVDIGEGWCHFDTTPRKDGSTFFLIKEADLMNYSINNKNSHNYDHSLYPVVN